MRPETPEYDVALYARISTKDGRQDAENQLVQLRDYCGKQGWRIAREFVDQESGGSSKRTEFQRMFEDARQRRFDLVLFWSLDRLSREGVLETLNHLQRLTDYGCGWKSYTESYLDSMGPFRDGVLALLACVARQERVRISERVRAGLDRARARGKQLGRPRAAVRPERVLELRQRGLSTRQIAREVGVSHMTIARLLAEV